MPQIIMLNHGAVVNQKRGEERYEAKKRSEDKAKENPVVMNGKRVTELNTDEFMAYWGNGLNPFSE